MLAIPLIVLVVSLVLLRWAKYNRLRFQNRDDRRMVADNVSLYEMAQGIGATKAFAQQLQQTCNSVVHMSEAAVPVTLSSSHSFNAMQPAT